MNNLLGELGLADIILVLNLFEGKKTNKALKRLQKIQTAAQLEQDDELRQILEELREWRKSK